MNTRFKIKLPVFLLVFLPFLAFAQEPKILTVEGEAQVEFPDTKSRTEVEKEAHEKASIDALEKAFGTMVIRGNSTYMKNVNTGQETKTTTNFNSIANSQVKGEVVDFSDENFEVMEGTGTIKRKKVTIRELKCTAKFKVRELADDVPDFDAFSLVCPDPGCKTTSFKDKNSLYLYFKSPYDGFLAVYLDNGKSSQCLLPYPHMPKSFDNGVAMSGSKEYILFAKNDEDYFGSPALVDQYELYAEDQLEQDRMFVIFARTPIANPGLKTGIDDNMLTAEEKANRYTLPKSLPSEDFQKWMIKNQTHRTDLKVMYIDITIQK